MPLTPHAKARRKLAVGLSICVALVYVAAFGWRYIHTLHRRIVIPNPTIPSPNAWQYFNEAYAAYKDRDEVDNQLYAPNLGEAFEPKKASFLVAENSGAISLIRKGLRYQNLQPSSRSDSDTRSHYRALGRLCLLQARENEGRQEFAGAMNSCLDAEEFGARIQQGEGTEGLLTGIAIESTGNRKAGPLVDRLNAAESAIVARRLAAIDVLQAPVADALEHEKWTVEALMAKEFRNHNSFAVADEIELGMSFESVLDLFMNRVFGPTVKVVVPSKAKMAWLRFAIATEPYDRAMDNYIRYTDDCIRIARLPFQKGAHTNVSMPTDPIGSFLSNPATWKVRCRKAINDCDNRQLELQLALHAYSLDHGRYPSALTMLVPAYIPSVPDDPFADAGPLRYRLTGKTYVLYSVGTDGIDDNGKPIVNKGGEAKDRYRVKTGDERGDFVAGVNY